MDPEETGTLPEKVAVTSLAVNDGFQKPLALIGDEKKCGLLKFESPPFVFLKQPQKIP